jgi:hypothetical protein
MQEIEVKKTFPLPTKKSSPSRPITITVFCVIGVLYSFIALPFQIYIGPLQFLKVHGKEWLVPLVLNIMGIIGLLGYWIMREWGVYVYSIAFIFGIAYALILYKIDPAEINFFGFVIPVVIVVIGFTNLGKMR